MKNTKITKTLIIILLIAITITLGVKGIKHYQADKEPEPVEVKEPKKEEPNPDLDVEKVNYDDYKNYKEANLDRYKAYHIDHSHLTADEIIWRVNQGLDKEPYKDVSIIEQPGETTVVVNQYRQLNQDYVPNDLVELESGIQLSERAKTAFDNLSKSAEEAGFPIHILAGYRNFEDQEKLYNKKLEETTREEADAAIARAGHSEHQTGLAIDVAPKSVKSAEENLEFASTETFEWLYDNAYRYGFIFSYKDGTDEITGYSFKPWHLRFVGEEIAIDMKEDSIRILEEFIDKGGLTH